MSNQNCRDADKPTARNVAIRYDKASITHTSQFLLSPGDEELVVDLSSGLIRETTGSETLPIHTRLSMSWSTAERLASLLNQVVQHRRSGSGVSAAPRAARQDDSATTLAKSSVPAPTLPVATIPSAYATQVTGG